MRIKARFLPGLAAGLVALVAMAGPAGAAGPTVTVTPSGPYSDQQVIEVSGTGFTPGAGINILECADPGGTTANLPTDASACDGNTIQGDSIIADASGNFDYKTYTLYQLPNALLGESSTQNPKCDATNYCVLYVGQNQNDFTQPKVFSAPFLFGTPVPESHLPITLPIAGIGGLLGAGFIVWRRRRTTPIAA